MSRLLTILNWHYFLGQIVIYDNGMVFDGSFNWKLREVSWVLSVQFSSVSNDATIHRLTLVHRLHVFTFKTHLTNRLRKEKQIDTRFDRLFLFKIYKILWTPSHTIPHHEKKLQKKTEPEIKGMTAPFINAIHLPTKIYNYKLKPQHNG